jgi:hypothetical protein
LAQAIAAGSIPALRLGERLDASRICQFLAPAPVLFFSTSRVRPRRSIKLYRELYQVRAATRGCHHMSPISRLMD